MNRQDRVEMIAAILTGFHIMNSKSDENFNEVMKLYYRYYVGLNEMLPK